jgi:hypothetical protein
MGRDRGSVFLGGEPVKNAFLFCMLCAIPLCLASCASAPPAPVLTVELFDSRAVSPPAAAEQPLLAEPEPAPQQPAQIVEERAVPAATAEPARALPAAAAAPRVLDAGLVTPTRPRMRTAAAWALPQPPAAAAGAAARTAATATADAPAKAAAAGAAAAATPGAATAGPKTNGATAKTSTGAGTKAAPAASGTTGSASPGGAAAAAAGSSGSASTASGAPQGGAATAATGSYGRLREIYAREGDELQVGLDGTGFLFLGFADTVNKTQGMSFKSKESRNGKTWFVFKALKIGTYDLDFLKQDNTTATSAKETVRVHVVSDQDFSTAVGQEPSSSAGGADAAEAGDPGFADKLSGLGSYEAAVAELLTGYKEGNPALDDQLAGLYMRMGKFDEAARYYAKNRARMNAYTRNAVLGLVRIALAQKDQKGFMTCLKQFLALDGADTEELLIQAARMERDKSEIGVGLDLAAEYVKRFPEGGWRDEADFLLAQLLEADSQFRDIARARDLYAAIVKDRPESAFAAPSRERLLYIDRHFFQVR